MNNLFAWVFKVYNAIAALAGACAAGFSSMLNALKLLSDAQGRRLTDVENEQAAQRAMLVRILAAIEPGPVAEIAFDVLKGGHIFQGATQMQLKDSEKFDVSLSPKDSKGAPSSIDPTKTTASVDDPTVATVTFNADGLTGTVTAVNPGKTQLQVSVQDASNTSDVVKGSLDIEVLAGDTATIAIGTSAPVAQ